MTAARKVLRAIEGRRHGRKISVAKFYQNCNRNSHEKYSAHLISEHSDSALNIRENLPQYSKDAQLVDARIVLRDNFDAILSKYKNVLIFGEDSGQIGDVNQGLEGLQEKYGEWRISDTGIREATILGQGIGLSMRGLRPIAEIQYLDYLLYALQIMSDDLATVRYRTYSKQKAPLIVRTRTSTRRNLAFWLSYGRNYSSPTWNSCTCSKKYDESGRVLQHTTKRR